jgi:hypothetical protein
MARDQDSKMPCRGRNYLEKQSVVMICAAQMKRSPASKCTETPFARESAASVTYTRPGLSSRLVGGCRSVF